MIPSQACRLEGTSGPQPSAQKVNYMVRQLCSGLSLHIQVLRTSESRDHTTSVGNQFQGLTFHHEGKGFLSVPPSLVFQLTILSHLLPPWPSVKGLAPSWWPPVCTRQLLLGVAPLPRASSSPDSPQLLWPLQSLLVSLSSPGTITGAHMDIQQNEHSEGHTNLCRLCSESWVWAPGLKNSSEDDVVRSAEDHRSPAGPSPSPITRREGSLCWCMVPIWAAYGCSLSCSPGPFPEPILQPQVCRQTSSSSVPSEVTGFHIPL